VALATGANDEEEEDLYVWVSTGI